MPELQKAQNKIVWEKWSAGKTPDIRPVGKDFVMDTMPFRATFRKKLTDDRPLQYQAGGKYISFKPAGIWWTTPQGQVSVKQKANPSAGNLTNGKVNYIGALGRGIDIKLSTERTRWQKEVIINSLSSLGKIPSVAEFLEISFEIETDFDIEGWDKKAELEFTEAIRLSELSQLESIKTWDSYQPTEKEIDEGYDPLLRCNGFLRVQDGKYYLVKQIPADYLRQAVYPVHTDVVISYGAEYEFNSADTDYISISALDSTHFVVVFRDVGGDNYGIAMIGVVSSGNEIAYGSEYTFHTNNTIHISCASLDSTHFVVTYGEVGGLHYGRAMIGVVSSGDNITFGSPYAFNLVATTSISCAALDATHFVVCYRDDGGDDFGHTKIGIVSGTPQDDITFGDEYTFNSASTGETSCSALDSTHFVVCYKDWGDSGHGWAAIGVVSGTPLDDIAFGSEYEFNNADTDFISCATLDSTHFVVGFKDDGGDDYGIAMIGVVSSGDNITFGSEYVFNSARTDYPSFAVIDATHFVVSFDDNISAGRSRLGTVSSGDNIAYGSEYTFNSVNTYQIVVALLDSTHFVVAFRDYGGDRYGIAMVGALPFAQAVGGGAVAIAGTLGWKFVQAVGTVGGTETLRPNAPGDKTDCTPFPDTGEANWEDVDEVGADDAETYVEINNEGSGSADGYDLYNLPASSGSGVINKIKVYVRSYGHGGGAGVAQGKVKPKIKTGGSEFEGDEFGMNDTWQTNSYEWATNPDTEAAWTWDEIDALQAGVWMSCGAEFSAYTRTTQIYVEVDYGIGVGIAGTLGRFIKTTVGSGSVGIAGTLARKILIGVGGGTVGIAGTLGWKFVQAVGSGSVGIAGALARNIKLAVGSGSVDIAGTLGRFIKTTVGGGAVGIAGTLVRLPKIATGGGTVGIAGTLARKILIAVGAGAVGIAGTLVTTKIGIMLKVVVITSQYRYIKVKTALYRKIRTKTSGG